MRPQAFFLERHSNNVEDPNATRAAALSNYSDLQIQTGSDLVDQWESYYVSQAFPWTLPRMVGGPDYWPTRRWRRTEKDAAPVSPLEFTRGMARRVEGQMREDWAFVPLIRNLFFRWQLLRTPKLSYQRHITMSRPAEDNPTELCNAGAGLYQKLWKGIYTVRGKKRKVAGDLTRLQHAEGLSSVEKQLLRSVGYMSSQIAGTQGIRLKIGHCLFGQRVVYGEGIFMTISPSERHSGLVLHLSRCAPSAEQRMFTQSCCLMGWGCR